MSASDPWAVATMRADSAFNKAMVQANTIANVDKAEARERALADYEAAIMLAWTEQRPSGPLAGEVLPRSVERIQEKLRLAADRWAAPIDIPGPPEVASIVWRLFCGAGHGLCFADHICEALSHGELEDGDPACPGCHDEADRNCPIRRAFSERLHAAGWRVGMSAEEAARLLGQVAASTPSAASSAP